MDIESLGMPTRVHTGVLYIKGKPLYIAEIVEENGNPAEFVTIYAAHQPRSNHEGSVTPVKAYDRVEKEIGKIKDTTPLGKIANRIHKPKKKIIQEPKPPLFMTDIQVGKDTFTGKEGKGFYEQEPDRVIIGKNDMKISHGERTGVFISFDSIVWERTRVPTSDILEDYRARKTLFFL